MATPSNRLTRLLPLDCQAFWHGTPIDTRCSQADGDDAPHPRLPPLVPSAIRQCDPLTRKEWIDGCNHSLPHTLGFDRVGAMCCEPCRKGSDWWEKVTLEQPYEGGCPCALAVGHEDGYPPPCKRLMELSGSDECLPELESLLKDEPGAAAHINCVDGELRSPLHFAVHGGATKVVQLLLKHEANPRGIFLGRWGTPIVCAADYDRMAIIEVLMRKLGPDGAKERAMPSGRTALHAAFFRLRYRKRLHASYVKYAAHLGKLTEEQARLFDESDAAHQQQCREAYQALERCQHQLAYDRVAVHSAKSSGAGDDEVGTLERAVQEREKAVEAAQRLRAAVEKNMSPVAQIVTQSAVQAVAEEWGEDVGALWAGVQEALDESPESTTFSF